MLARILVLLALCVAPAVVSAHGGGVDENGGHVDRSTNTYHCHRDGCVLPAVEAPEEGVEDPPDGDDQETLTISGSWGTAKSVARNTIYAGRNTTFYCGCQYTPNSTSSGGTIDHTACGYDGVGDPHAHRAGRLEWEHIVPASLMPARSFPCWNEGLPACSDGGRGCCESHDMNARAQIFDLHNLVPSVGQPNAIRGNKRYGLIAGEARELGACDFEWDAEVAEPPTEGDGDRRGDVARIWLYFVTRHGLVLEPGELAMYLQWSMQDPPRPFEFTRNARIRTHQGNGNPFVEMFPH